MDETEVRSAWLADGKAKPSDDHERPKGFSAQHLAQRCDMVVDLSVVHNHAPGSETLSNPEGEERLEGSRCDSQERPAVLGFGADVRKRAIRAEWLGIECGVGRETG